MLSYIGGRGLVNKKALEKSWAKVFAENLLEEFYGYLEMPE